MSTLPRLDFPAAEIHAGVEGLKLLGDEGDLVRFRVSLWQLTHTDIAKVTL